MSGGGCTGLAYLLPAPYIALHCHRSNVIRYSSFPFATYLKFNFNSSPVSDNRASLLRSSAPPKKTPTESQRDAMSRLWKNQVAMAMRLAPAVPSVSVRCASPDLSLRLVQCMYIFQTSYYVCGWDKVRLSAHVNRSVYIPCVS